MNYERINVILKVEIVMNMEEEFGITVEEDNSQNITTVQEAADLIEKLVAAKPADAAEKSEATA
jgi:hypothetical protein